MSRKSKAANNEWIITIVVILLFLGAVSIFGKGNAIIGGSSSSVPNNGNVDEPAENGISLDKEYIVF